MYDLFKPIVFEWLTTISNGTNKSVVEQLLTPKGISYTFDLPMSLSKRLFEKWKLKN